MLWILLKQLLHLYLSFHCTHLGFCYGCSLIKIIPMRMKSMWEIQKHIFVDGDFSFCWWELFLLVFACLLNATWAQDVLFRNLFHNYEPPTSPQLCSPAIKPLKQLQSQIFPSISYKYYCISLLFQQKYSSPSFLRNSTSADSFYHGLWTYSPKYWTKRCTSHDCGLYR